MRRTARQRMLLGVVSALVFGAGLTASIGVGSAATTATTTSATTTSATTTGATTTGATTTSTTTTTGTTTTTSATAPSNTSPPTISGTPTVGQKLTASNGSWKGSTPMTFSYQWSRCDSSGGSCSAIAGATSNTYTLTSADAGNTVRVAVTAKNSAGSSTATSVPSALIGSPATPAPTGCPKTTASTQAVDVADVTSPARLQVDAFASNPSLITRGTSVFTLRVHVTDTCGQPVQGALVYATAVPYDQVTIPPEQGTDANGYVTLTFNRMRGFPASRNQQLLVFFIRARKPSDTNVLAGISTRRLISIPVSLRG